VTALPSNKISKKLDNRKH